jgi:phenylpropionate dioxygenase-like ring-hydroxylating dioxygenase large terminal subunit
MNEASGRWFPVMRLEELVPRHVAQTELWGQEIALWRADDGGVNAWENRCPHRGVRLSIGQNTGSELRCRYHGWRFASGDGRCTHIPADPLRPPPAVLCATVYNVAVQDGFVWVALSGPDRPPPSQAGGLAWLTLRSTPVEAGAERVRAVLMDATHARPHDAFTLVAEVEQDGAKARLTLMLQPMGPARTVIHAAVAPPPAPADRLTVLRQHAARLARIRDKAEAP